METVTYIKKTVVKDKTGLAVEPSFLDAEVVFHPIPKPQQATVQEGDEVEGFYSPKVYDSGKKDRNGKHIKTRYFILKD